MKKVLSVLLIAVLLVSALVVTVGAEAWDGTASADFAGEGTEASPYLIASAANLKKLADNVNAGEAYAGKIFNLTADIDLGSKEWTPIGNVAKPFSGTFDGKDHKITGLSITDKTVYSVGLFGAIYPTADFSAGVKNLELDGEVNIDGIAAVKEGTTTASTDAGVGTLVGWAYKDATDGFKTLEFENIVDNVNLTVKAGDQQPRVGGVFGYIFTANVKNVIHNGDVTVDTAHLSRVGGISGQTNRSKYYACVNNGDITVNQSAAQNLNVAGFCSMITFKTGVNEYTEYDYCINTGKITGIVADGLKKAVYAGGIVGTAYSPTTPVYIKVTNCLNSGDIYAQTGIGAGSGSDAGFAYAGGIVGYAQVYNNFIIENCVNTSASIVSKCEKGERAGGIVGVMNQSTNDTYYTKNCLTVGKTAGYYVTKTTDADKATWKENLAADDAALLAAVKAITDVALPEQNPDTGDSVAVIAAVAVVAVVALFGTAIVCVRRKVED